MQLRGRDTSGPTTERALGERIGTRLGGTALVLVVWFVGALVFFRPQWRSGWNWITGDDGDSRLVVYLNEHWFQVFHGQASWLNPQFLYPVKGLLGWSDTFFLYQVFYSPLRLFGADPFLATQLTIVFLSLVGFASFYGLTRVAFGAGRTIALAFALAFTFSNTLWLHAGAYQDNGVWLDPLVALCGVLAWRAAREGRRLRAAVLGFGCGALAIMLLYSAYYTGYFSALALGALVLVALVFWRGHFVRSAIDGVVRCRVAVIAAAVGFLIGLGPFLETYLPAQRALPSDNYAIALAYAGRLHDLINVGGGNVLWSSAIHSVLSRMNYQATEVTYAPTPIVWVVAIGGGIVCAWWLRSSRAIHPSIARFAVALAATTIVMALVPLHTTHFTMWAVIHHFPGARAMRAIDRGEIITGYVAMLAGAAASTEVFGHLSWTAAHHFGPRRGARNWLLYPAVVLLALLVFEQLNTRDNSLVSRRVQTALLASTRPAPSGCRSFFVINSQTSSLPFYEYQIDAMLVSQRLGIPTLNGYTAYNPAGWTLEHPGTVGYTDAVDSWVTLHHLQGVCQLDLAGMTWSQAGGS